MPVTSETISKRSPKVEARCSKGFKRRVTVARGSIGESDFVRTALEEFLARHKGRKAIQAAYEAIRQLEIERKDARKRARARALAAEAEPVAPVALAA